MIRLNEFEIHKIEFNNYASKVYGINKKSNSIAVSVNDYTVNLLIKVNDVEMTKIIQSEFLTLNEKLKLLTSRFMMNSYTEDIFKYGDGEWERI